MDSEAIMGIVNSPLVPKLFLLAAGLGILVFCRKRDIENVTGIFIASLGIFVVRDILLQVFGSSLSTVDFFFVSDLVVLSSLFFVFFMAFRARANAFLLLALNAAILGLYLSDCATGWIPFDSAPLFRASLGAGLIWFAIFSLLRAKAASSVSQLLLARTWIMFSAFYAVYIALAAVFGYGNEAVQRLLVPASYLVYLASCGYFLGLIEIEGQKEREYLTNTIDSIYAFMDSSGAAFKSAATLEQLLSQINGSLMQETGADGAIIAMVDEFDDILSVKAYSGVFPPPFKLPQDLPRKQSRVETFMKHAQFKLGENVLGESAKSGRAIFIEDAASDPRIFRNADDDFLAMSSLIVTPLSLQEKVIGVIALSRKPQRKPFTDSEFERARMLADFGSIVIRNLQSAMESAEKSTIDKETSIAEDIQKTFLPKKLLDMGKMSFGGFTSPARGVYSDYYDIIRNRQDSAVLVMSDVAGKGIHASLVMVMIRSLLHLTTSTSRDIGTILTWVNRGITGKIEMDHFATLALAMVNLETGSIQYASAAHQHAMVVRKVAGEVEFVELESVPIGVDKKNEYSSVELQLQPGDSLVMYTDGILEAMNIQGKQYGKKRLGDVILRNAGQPAKDLAVTVRKDVQDFIGQARQHDDQSILIMRMKA